jgi:GINS complex subunit 1
MSGYARAGLDLLRELQRDPTFVPPYNDDGIKSVVSEIDVLVSQHQQASEHYTEAELATNPAVSAAFVVRHQAVHRNKRCVLAYLAHRAARLRTLRWEVGQTVPETLRARVSAGEEEYLRGYNTLLTTYMRAVGTDLTAGTEPPQEHLIEVRVIKDCGDVFVDSGVVTLRKNTTHLMRASEAEPLIRQGHVEHVLT